MKKIYFVRHCSADGQHKDAPLTKMGIQQAVELATFFEKEQVTFDLILTSPYLRAIESIKPYTQLTGIPIEYDERLKERILSEDPVEDWMEALEKSFMDYSFSLHGGESARDVMARANEVIHEITRDASINNVIIVSHGNLLSHLFNQYDNSFGFEQWKELRNPDIYLLQLDSDNNSSKLECIWNPDNY
ncbi:histidine phosphatase family protein [Oceanobacillus saliphilus]|uniref:histidine phosphatase family protein n=1 Tax=Oceanobacillus saliphilus TaxID=2925834 RepID=UPI00201D786F|nr:histidine phosphatase family protein [Oceanobacillus saliphilus]